MEWNCILDFACELGCHCAACSERVFPREWHIAFANAQGACVAACGGDQRAMDRDIAEVVSPHVITVADQFAQAMHVAFVEQPLAEPRKKFVDFSARAGGSDGPDGSSAGAVICACLRDLARLRVTAINRI